MNTTCADYLLRYGWPGNVRELENAIEHTAVLCVNDLILPKHLPGHIAHAEADPRTVAADSPRTLAP